MNQRKMNPSFLLHPSLRTLDLAALGLSIAAALLFAGAAARADSPRPPSPDGELVAVEGTELFVRRIGAGEPLVVVHGGPVLEHGYFLPHLEILAEDVELIFYDQRFSGRSAAEASSPSELSLKTFADDLEALRVALDLGEIHVLGHSWGGLIAMRYAVDYGENLRSLVLSNPSAPSAGLMQREQQKAASLVGEEDRARGAEIRESEAFQQRRPEAIRELLLHTFRSQFHDREKSSGLDLYVPEDYIARSGRFASLAAELQTFELAPALKEAWSGKDLPMLILYGAAEPGVEIGGPVLRTAAPNADFVVLPESGHFPFIEQPDDFAAAVRRTMRRGATEDRDAERR